MSIREGPGTAAAPPQRERRTTAVQPPAAIEQLRRPLTFAVALALSVYLAISDGGYDVVVRQEVTVAIWWLLALGFAFRVLPRARPPHGAVMALSGVAILLAITALSIAWTSSDARAVAELTRLLGYAGIVVLAWACLGPRTWIAAAEGLVVGAVAVCALAVASRLEPDLLTLSEIERALDSERLFQPLGYWNGVATWAAMTVAMVLAWSVDGRPLKIRAAALAAAPLGIVTVYLTYSRGGVLGLALGIALVLVLSRNRRRAALHAGAAIGASLPVIAMIEANSEIANGSGSQGAWGVALVLVAAIAFCWWVARATRGVGRRGAESRPASPENERAPRSGRSRLLLAGGLVAGALVLSVAGTALVDRLGEEEAAAVVPSEDPTQHLTTASGNRPAYWDAALEAFWSEPIRGIGPGTYEYWWAERGEGSGLVADAHSLYLETLAELGLVGLVGLALGIAGLGLAAARGWLAAMPRAPAPATAMLAAAGVYIVAAGFDWMWELTAVSVLGLGAAAVVASAATEPLRGPESVPGRLVPAFALAAVAIVAGAIQVPGTVSAERSRASDEQLALGDPVGAIELADDAVTAAPWEGEPYAVRARAERSNGELQRALADAETAVSKETLESEHRLLVAEIQADLGHPEAADAALDSAFFLSPRSPSFRRPRVLQLVDRIESLRAGEP